MTSCAMGRITRARARRIHLEVKEVSEPPHNGVTCGPRGSAGSFARLLIEWKLAQLSGGLADSKSA